MLGSLDLTNLLCLIDAVDVCEFEDFGVGGRLEFHVARWSRGTRYSSALENHGHDGESDEQEDASEEYESNSLQEEAATS